MYRVDARMMRTDRVPIVKDRDGIVPGKLNVLQHALAQHGRVEEVWLLVVVRVTKPPELVPVPYKTLTTVDFHSVPSREVVSAHAQIELETRHYLTDNPLSLQ